MANITVRNLPDEVHRALRVRAAAQGRSTEAEVRLILEQAVIPQTRVKMGEALANLGRRLKLSEADVKTLRATRDRKPAKPVKF